MNYEHEGIRTIRLYVDDDHHIAEVHVPEGIDCDPVKPASAPRVTVDQDAMWSPADGVA